MSNYLIDGLGLPLVKINRDPFDDESRQIGAEDVNAFRQSFIDIRSSIITGKHGFASVLAYGAKGDGIANDGPAIQAAIDANPVAMIYFPAGIYKILSTLYITRTSTHLVGQFDARGAQYGSQLLYMGTGVCIQIGTDNGLGDWAFADATHGYDGPQGHRFENLCISHGASDTALTAAAGAVQYKAGTTGIWDWRGGNLTMRNVWIEHFETNIALIQSDINLFEFVTSIYSPNGVYVGPRSDQNRFIHLYSYFSDRSVIVDRAGQTELIGSIFAFCGTNVSSAVEVRRGSHGFMSYGCWHENSGAGYAGTTQSMYSVGEVNGYGAGGSISSAGGTATTTSVAGAEIRAPHCYNVPAGAYHTTCLASVGKCNQFVLDKPTEYINSGLSSFDALVEIRSGQVPTTTDTQIAIYDCPPTMTRSQLFQNLGGGSVGAAIRSFGVHDSVTLGMDNTASHVIRGTVNHSVPNGANAFTITNSLAGQTIATAMLKLLFNGSSDTSAGALFPFGLLIQMLGTRSAGASSVGQTALSIDCNGAQSNTALATARGDVRFNQTSGIVEIARGFYLSNEVAPAALSADQTDWTFTGLADCSLIIVTSTVNVAINSLALTANSAGGRDVIIWNGNASGGATVTLKDQAIALGTPSMRFIGRSYADVPLAPAQWARLRYSVAKSRILVF